VKEQRTGLDALLHYRMLLRAKFAGQGDANSTKPNGSANVGIQGDLWQAKPDTGSALE
jgi:hypothetical protein